jgi:hypothetical protein
LKNLKKKEFFFLIIYYLFTGPGLTALGIILPNLSFCLDFLKYLKKKKKLENILIIDFN